MLGKDLYSFPSYTTVYTTDQFKVIVTIVENPRKITSDEFLVNLIKTPPCFIIFCPFPWLRYNISTFYGVESKSAFQFIPLNWFEKMKLKSPEITQKIFSNNFGSTDIIFGSISSIEVSIHVPEARYGRLNSMNTEFDVNKSSSWVYETSRPPVNTYF